MSLLRSLHYTAVLVINVQYPTFMQQSKTSFIWNNFMARGNQKSWDSDVIFRSFGTLSFYREFTGSCVKKMAS